MLKAVIFDLDGTLVDSEAVWTKAWTKALKKHEKQYDPALQKHLMSKPAKENFSFLTQTYDLSIEPDEFGRDVVAAYKEIEESEGVSPKPGVEDFLRALKAAGAKIAVATSASRAYVERLFDRLGWTSMFDTIVSTEEVPNGKPAPDVYLKAVEKLGCDKDGCVAVEDSPNGAASAKAAGLPVLGIIDKRYNDELPGVDDVTESYLDLSVERLEKMIK
ncbi:MAG: HAD family phosphatase [Patescibacteria group bacterium]|jgi:HAD superfamily hydrolase (TIGR01509 family)